jgi:ParB/RepB/Spo0J family partition protein
VGTSCHFSALPWRRTTALKALNDRFLRCSFLFANFFESMIKAREKRKQESIGFTLLEDFIMTLSEIHNEKKDFGTAPDDGKLPNAVERAHCPVDDPSLHPQAAYDGKSKGPLEYTLVHAAPSWLLPVRRDKRSRTGAEYQEFFADFTENVRTYGVLQPIIAVREGDGARTVEGESRRLAALIVGLQMVPVIVYEWELTESELIIAQLISNAQRKDFAEHELAVIYVQLMALNGWSQHQVAEFVHVSSAQVCKVVDLEKPVRSVPDHDAGRRSASARGLLPKPLHDHAKQLELAKQCDVVYSVEGLRRR